MKVVGGMVLKFGISNQILCHQNHLMPQKLLNKIYNCLQLNPSNITITV
jgi:hypothetical protein